MAVGWVLPPGQSVRSIIPWVSPIARSLHARELVLFWIERRPGEKHDATSRELALDAESLPNEVEPLIESLSRDAAFDAPTDLIPVVDVDEPSTPGRQTTSKSNKSAGHGSADADTADRRTEDRRTEDRRAEDEDAETEAAEPIRVSIISIRSEGWSARVLRLIDDRRITKLVVPRPLDDADAQNDADQLQRLLLDAHSEILHLRLGEQNLPSASETSSPPSTDVGQRGSEQLKILVAAGPGNWSRLAIRRAHRLAEIAKGQLTAVYVEPDVDDFATQAGYEILQDYLQTAIGDASDEVERRIVLDNTVADGLSKIVSQYDLVILGSRHTGRVFRWMQAGISEKILRSSRAGRTSFAIIRMPAPIGRRIFASIEEICRNTVPQLERERRVSLVQRIQSSSQWDFDFVTLICLSTLIATCGLLQSSAPVVIGAMLVAPLMTPLLAAGLSLVQGNPILLKNALTSVLRGFLLAFGLALSIGWLMRWGVPWSAVDTLVTPEIAARGNPRLLDLIVALVSGIAAAYASGRPNLLSALPGVAIASALVPPIAALGLGMAWGQWPLAFGAGLLFLTNIVAIVLGTAYAFWAVGIRGAARHGFLQSQTWRALVALTLILIGLAIIESLPARRIPAELELVVSEYVDRLPGAELREIEWQSPSAEGIVVRLRCAQPLALETLEDLALVINRDRSPKLHVQIQSELVSDFFTSHPMR